MARRYAKIVLSVWGDRDFRDLTHTQQWLYFALISHQKLSACGVMEWKPNRLVTMASDFTRDQLDAALKVLQERGYVLLDEDTEELLVRSFIRHDDGLKIPNVSKTVARDVHRIFSTRIFDAVVEEMRRLRVEFPGWAAFRECEILRLIGAPQEPDGVMESDVSNRPPNGYGEGSNPPPNRPSNGYGEGSPNSYANGSNPPSNRPPNPCNRPPNRPPKGYGETCTSSTSTNTSTDCTNKDKNNFVQIVQVVQDQSDLNVSGGAPDGDTPPALPAGLADTLAERYPGVDLDDQWARFMAHSEGREYHNREGAFVAWVREHVRRLAGSEPLSRGHQPVGVSERELGVARTREFLASMREKSGVACPPELREQLGLKPIQ